MQKEKSDFPLLNKFEFIVSSSFPLKIQALNTLVVVYHKHTFHTETSEAVMWICLEVRNNIPIKIVQKTIDKLRGAIWWLGCILNT